VATVDERQEPALERAPARRADDVADEEDVHWTVIGSR
jgi:hypothetical protein